jgi:polyferredoxin
MSHRSWTWTRRQYQAVAWAFMLSLLVGALVSFVQEWLTPPDVIEWGISEGMFVGIILTLAAIALCGLVATLKVERSA